MNYKRLFIIISAILVVLRIGISAVFPLSSDEAYHWEWSRHLAFGYYDHPPFTAYVIFIFTSILGNTEIGVRFGAIVLMTLTSVIIYKLCKDISGDERTAFWSGMLVNIIPILNIFFVYISTDPAAIFFWALTLWLGWRAILHEQKPYWYLLGLAIGGGLLAKFLNVLIIPGLGLTVVLSAKKRQLLRTKEPYLGAIITLIVITPFIIWNATNGWATFSFNLAKRHALDFNGVHFAEYILGQLLVVSPLLFMGLVYSTCLFWSRWRHERNDSDLFLASTSSIMFLFFLIMSFFGRIGAHWPASGYLATCAGLPYLAFKEGNIFIRRHARKAVIFSLAIIFIAYALLTMAYFTPEILENIALKFTKESDEIYELHGWKEISAEVERRTMESNAIIITPSYASCSMLAFYTPSKMQTHMFGRGAIHGLNYLYWDGDFSQFNGGNALWVYKEPPKKDDLRIMRLSFESVGDAKQYQVSVTSSKKRTFYFVECRKLIQYKVE